MTGYNTSHCTVLHHIMPGQLGLFYKCDRDVLTANSKRAPSTVFPLQGDPGELGAKVSILHICLKNVSLLLIYFNKFSIQDYF